jgi:hypothetical protein
MLTFFSLFFRNSRHYAAKAEFRPLFSKVYLVSENGHFKNVQNRKVNILLKQDIFAFCY